MKSGETFREIRPAEVVQAARVAPFTGIGVTPQWTDVVAGTERSAWAVAFDTMSFNLETNTPYSGVYGQTKGLFRFANTYKNPVFGIDIQKLAPGSEGLSATRFTTDIVWNPGGTYERSGSGRLAMAIVCANRFGSKDNAPSSFSQLGPFQTVGQVFGLIVDFGVQQHGWRTYNVDLSTSGLSIPMPAVVTPTNPGALIVAIGTLDAQGRYVMCPQGWAMQPTMDTMAAPNDPNYPGANPSQSGPLQWDDDGGSIVTPVFNGRHDNLATTGNAFTEIYSYDWTSSVAGYPQASAGLFYKPGGNRLSGTVEGAAPGLLNVILFASDSNGNLVPAPGGGVATRSVVVSVAGDGSFSVADPLISVQGGGQAGTVIGAFGGSEGTLQTVSEPFLVGGSGSIPPVQIAVGDVDRSGEVDAADIDAVISAFGSIFGNNGWNPATDLDQSEEVDAADIDIVIAHFGQTGDPLPNLP